MPAERSYGMDHPHYHYSPIPERPSLRWPDGKALALGALILLEHYEWQPPEAAYSLRNPSGGLIKLPSPDYLQLTHREYGHRVGVFVCWTYWSVTQFQLRSPSTLLQH